MTLDTHAPDSRRSVLGRAFDILDCFAENPHQSIAGLCDQTGLPPATVHRMLSTLVEWGAVERSARGHYCLGMRLWRLGWVVPSAREIRDVARPFMVDLYAATREIVVLASRDEDRLLLVDQIAGHRAGTAWQDRTRRVRLGVLAPGLVHLAHLPLPELRRMRTEVDLGLSAELADNEFRLLQSLAKIRSEGVAVSRSFGRGWVSAPIFDAEGTLRSALSMVVPDDRLNPSGHGRLVSQAAQAISRGLLGQRRQQERHQSEAHA